MRPLFILLSIFTLFACNDNDDFDVSLCFVGDSMVANWDIEQSFPNRITENRGRDGIGISELREMSLIGDGKDVVVLIGTNDIRATMGEKDISMYVDEYFNAVTVLGGKRVFLLSVLPTADIDKNRRIERFNEQVAAKVSVSSKFVFINCYDTFLQDEVLRVDLSRDGTHLNDYGYVLLSDKLKEKL